MIMYTDCAHSSFPCSFVMWKEYIGFYRISRQLFSINLAVLQPSTSIAQSVAPHCIELPIDFLGKYEIVWEAYGNSLSNYSLAIDLWLKMQFTYKVIHIRIRICILNKVRDLNHLFHLKCKLHLYDIECVSTRVLIFMGVCSSILFLRTATKAYGIGSFQAYKVKLHTNFSSLARNLAINLANCTRNGKRVWNKLI